MIRDKKFTNHDGEANDKDTVVWWETMAACIQELFLFYIPVESSSAAAAAAARRLVRFRRINGKTRNSVEEDSDPSQEWCHWWCGWRWWRFRVYRGVGFLYFLCHFLFYFEFLCLESSAAIVENPFASATRAFHSYKWVYWMTMRMVCVFQWENERFALCVFV